MFYRSGRTSTKVLSYAWVCQDNGVQSKKGMDTQKKTKVGTLVIVAIVLCILPFDVEWSSVGIYTGCDIWQRLLYSFFHANIVHALLNVWCLLSVVFLYRIKLWVLVAAFLIAMSVPTFCLTSTPTVGLSGVVFALFAMLSFSVQRKLYYQSWMVFYLVMGFLMPNVNAYLHLYCYTIGFIVALLNKPIKLKQIAKGN
jgi:membrane associated rhomboid family serine protease